MSLADTIQNLAGYSRIFPNVETAGYYDPLSQAVTVRIADRSKYESIGATDDEEDFLFAGEEFFSVCFHELTHWLDHVSTLWGQRSLVDIHNALNAWFVHDEQEFWRIVQVETQYRRGTLQNYYTTVNQPHAAQPWRQQLTSGLEFDAHGRLSTDRPIAFMTFSTMDNQRICRVPLTTAALLETRAVWAEYYTIWNTLFASESERALVERGLRQQQMLNHMYDPRLALYSAATHLAANSLELTNAYQAYELSAALALVCLNLPDNAFETLKIPNSIAERLGKRVAGFIDRRDRGFAFLALARAAPPVGTDVNVREWLQEAVARAGLAPLEEIDEQVRSELERLPTTLIQGPVEGRARVLLSLGRQNYNARGMLVERPLSLQDTVPNGPYILPPIVLDDGQVVHVSHKQVTDSLLQPEQSTQLAYQYFDTTRDFLRACTP